MAERGRVARLERLSRVRAAERLHAAAQAARSGENHSRLEELASRSATLAGLYGGRTDAADGAMLANLLAFRRELANLSQATARDAGQAAKQAETARQSLAAADKRWELARDRHKQEKRKEDEARIAAEQDLARKLNRRVGQL